MSKFDDQINDYAIYGLREEIPVKSRRTTPESNFFKDLILEMQRLNDNLELIAGNMIKEKTPIVAEPVKIHAVPKSISESDKK